MEYRRAFIDNSMVFITIVTHNRLPILITNIEVIKKVVINVIKLYQFSIFAYSIQPDHIHCIIKPRNIEDYPKIIKSFKYAFTKYVGLVKPTYNKVWQNRYWEHTIRDKKDLYNHLDYIHYNPVKHNLINSVKDWDYSSFKKFVKKGWYEENWGCHKDIEDICTWDFE